ncbi:MAG: methyltransferase [Helicobacter sp.]|nr:methyltransferase [Helicobacter sp.]
MQIYQPKNGYCYNSDTLFLYDFARKSLKSKQEVLEIGTGTGVLGLLCAREIPLKLHLIEKNPTMIELCRHNLRINGVLANLIEADFLEYDFANQKFDSILSNPPFYHDGVLKSSNDDIFQARYEENLPFEEMIKKINFLLKPQGEFIFCYSTQAVYKLFYWLMTYKIRPITLRFVHPSLQKQATLLLCRAKKSSKSKTQILPPLFTHDKEGFSAEVQAIYQKANTWSIKC